jgi:hypothetical protein
VITLFCSNFVIELIFNVLVGSLYEAYGGRRGADPVCWIHVHSTLTKQLVWATLIISTLISIHNDRTIWWTIRFRLALLQLKFKIKILKKRKEKKKICIFYSPPKSTSILYMCHHAFAKTVSCTDTSIRAIRLTCIDLLTFHTILYFHSHDIKIQWLYLWCGRYTCDRLSPKAICMGKEAT